jgi:hypothetical protein
MDPPADLGSHALGDRDATPFVTVLVALRFERPAVRRRWGMLRAMGPVVASLSINLWGVIWSRSPGW